MGMKTFIVLVTVVCVGAMLVQKVVGWQSEKVLLTDVKALTLHNGRMTTARRSSAVPQLKCVGGTAGCSTFVPQTVQCINRGSDGYDVQWECKTDMDNSYRFGKVQVSCEGYDSPDDPYVLKGSCGLEYTIDLTEEGYQKKNSGGYGYNTHNTNTYSKTKSTSIFQDLIYLGMIAGVIYIIYKVCIAPRPPSNQSDGPPSYEETLRNQGNQGNQQPPPYGFNQSYMPNQGPSPSAPPDTGFCGGQTHTPPPTAGTNTNTTGGGFWTGMGTGGLLGYLFGSRNTGYGHHRGRGWGNNWGGSGWGNNWGNTGGSSWTRAHTGDSWGGSSSSRSSSSSSGSSGTRTASGFGGTSRR